MTAHRIHEGRNLRYGICVNRGPLQFNDVHASDQTPTWRRNVLRVFFEGQSLHSIEGGDTIIRLYLLDPGLVVSRLVIN